MFEIEQMEVTEPAQVLSPEKEPLIQEVPIEVRTAVHETFKKVVSVDTEEKNKPEMTSKEKPFSKSLESGSELDLKTENTIFYSSLKSHIVRISDKHILMYMEDAIALTRNFAQSQSCK